VPLKLENSNFANSVSTHTEKILPTWFFFLSTTDPPEDMINFINLGKREAKKRKGSIKYVVVDIVPNP
jgi:hypothetical protein